MSNDNNTKVRVYLDDASEPFGVYDPPASFKLDTSSMEDGPHVLRVETRDATGRTSSRTIPFEVRNGPVILIGGIASHEVVDGVVQIKVNAYGSRGNRWEPRRAESPTEAPAWPWVILIGIAAWALYYGVAWWVPPPQYANTPTFEKSAFSAHREAKPPSKSSSSSSSTSTSSSSGSSSTASSSSSTSSSSSSASAKKGASIYASHCASCHQSNGEGIPHTFPPLKNNPVVTAKDPTDQIRIVLFGLSGKTIKGVKYSASMPTHTSMSNQEIAEVINHERTSWGNHAPTVTPAQVKEVRDKGPPKKK